MLGMLALLVTVGCGDESSDEDNERGTYGRAAEALRDESGLHDASSASCLRDVSSAPGDADGGRSSSVGDGA